MPRCNVKGRWHVTQPRGHWTEQDYIDFRWAITQSINTTHGVYGINTKKLIAQIDAELMSRYGVSIARGGGMTPLSYPIADAVKVSGLSRSQLDRAIRAGHLPPVARRAPTTAPRRASTSSST